MKIASWNVNSLRVRLPHVLAWLESAKPDVLALQELKIPDDVFPVQELEQAGYHAVFSGQKTYNGVAILSKEKATDVVTDFPDIQDPQRRVLCATIDGVRILNVYIPNGQDVESDKYQYKLAWLKAMHAFLKSELQKHDKLVVLGDFNIAPEDIDVHNPASWKGKVLCSKPEREALQKIMSLGLYDCFRELNPDDQLFSWWDYRLNAFKRDMGLRIDLILATEAMLEQCKSGYIDQYPRTLERPSDHTPVVAEFS